MQRKQSLSDGHIYHIFNRSIAGYTIFPSRQHYERFQKMICFYQFSDLENKFSEIGTPELLRSTISSLSENAKYCVDVLAYCLMPNHCHLILKQNESNGISNFMRNVQNSYSHFFNIRHNRQGPLWAGKFKNVLCESNEQLLHLSRYIHLNPVTAHLTDKPENWAATSFHEYTSIDKTTESFCHFQKHIGISPQKYLDFVTNHIEEQRNLAMIKHLLFD